MARDDRSARVRHAALGALTAQGTRVDNDVLAAALNGVPIDDRWAAETDALALRDPAQVDAELEWKALSGPRHFEALGRNDAEWVNRHVRADLEDDFERLKERSIAPTIASLEDSLETESGRSLTDIEKTAVAAAVRNRLDEELDEKVRVFVLGQFRVAALRLLVLHGRAEDAEIARRFATDDDYDVRIEALRLLDRFAGPDDAGLVRDMLGSLYGDEQRQAAALLLRLSPSDERLQLLAELRSEFGLRTWAVDQLRTIDDEEATHEALNLMWDKDNEIRLVAVDVALERLPGRKKHEVLLEFYLSRGSYFYNVVRALDRDLYARTWLRDALAALASG